jgi:hypothetical protein
VHGAKGEKLRLALQAAAAGGLLGGLVGVPAAAHTAKKDAKGLPHREKTASLQAYAVAAQRKLAEKEPPIAVVNDQVRPRIGLEAPMPLHHQEGLFMDKIQPGLDPAAFEELSLAAQGDELQEQNEAEFFRQQAGELQAQNQELQQALGQAQEQAQAQEQQAQMAAQQAQEQQMAQQEQLQMAAVQAQQAQQVADQRTQESLAAAQEAFKQRQLASDLRGAALQYKAHVSAALQNDPTEALMPTPLPSPAGMDPSLAMPPSLAPGGAAAPQPPMVDPAMAAQMQAQGAQPGAPPGAPPPAGAAPAAAPKPTPKTAAHLRRLDSIKIPTHLFAR